MYAICSIRETQPRHWTQSSCICLRYQSSTYYPKPVYVLPIAYLTHGSLLIVCLYATYLLLIGYIDYILKAHCTSAYLLILYTLCLDAVCTYALLKYNTQLILYTYLQCSIYIASPLPIYSLHSLHPTHTTCVYTPCKLPGVPMYSPCTPDINH